MLRPFQRGIRCVRKQHYILRVSIVYSMDRVSKSTRSRMMSRVRGRDTKPEKRVRSLLHRLGYRFRLHRSDLPGKPDIALPKYRKAIFVHGCFWHQHPGCQRANRPNTNKEFWNDKLDRNVARDRKNGKKLEKLGWSYLIVWECETKDQSILRDQLISFIDRAQAGRDR